MRLRSWQTILIVVMAAAAVLLVAVPAEAQCSMCRAVLTGSNNSRFLRNLDIAVLVLLIPPVSIFCSIFVLLRKYKATD